MLQGSVRFGFFTSLPVKVTLFHASLENSDPTIEVPRASNKPRADNGRFEPAGMARQGLLKFRLTALVFAPAVTPRTISPSSAAILVIVKMFWMTLPVRRPVQLDHVSRMITPMPTSTVGERLNRPN